MVQWVGHRWSSGLGIGGPVGGALMVLWVGHKWSSGHRSLSLTFLEEELINP